MRSSLTFASAYLANYDMALAQRLIAGVDVWLNTPEPPMEASGTSGMKAALNGVPSLSILDGWWIEGCIEGVTGWAIGERCDAHGQSRRPRRLRCRLALRQAGARRHAAVLPATGSASWTSCATPSR